MTAAAFESLVRVRRLLAFASLLAQPDERTLRGPRGRRGHKMTQPGKRDRFAKLWLVTVRVWTEGRLAAHAGPLEGWQPAVVSRKVLRMR